MKILVTGGAGFIGCNFVYYMLEKYPDYDIVCLDALTYAGNLKSLDEAMKNPKFSFVKGSISDREFVDGLFAEQKFDIVVNFAAESHVDRSIENPFIFLETNVMGTVNLLNCAKAAWELPDGSFIRLSITRDSVFALFIKAALPSVLIIFFALFLSVFVDASDVGITKRRA